jgi:hypothetical protein
MTTCLWSIPGAEGLGTSRTSTTKAAKPSPSQLFDILPIHGVLEPGQKEQMEFSFYAFPGVKATAQAACSVVDGPVYQVWCGLLWCFAVSNYATHVLMLKQIPPCRQLHLMCPCLLSTNK